MSLPLEGLRVIDFSWLVAGPYATRTLADFGAEIIKVQSAMINNGMEQNNNYEFEVINRNKHSITLNMSLSEAREIVRKLVVISDIVIQNFSPRVLENWCLTYSDIKKLNPAIIMVDLSGFGNSGPWKNYVALADTIEAISGITLLSSYSPECPAIIAFPYADIVSGMFADISVLAALEHRKTTGRGIHIEISEMESMCTVIGTAILDHVKNKSPFYKRTENPPGIISFDGCYKCKGNDDWIVISITRQQQWQRFCKIMGNPDWINKGAYSTLSRCTKNHEYVNYHIGQWTRNKSTKSVIRLLRKARIPCSKVNNAKDVANDPNLLCRDYFITLSDPERGQITMDSTPILLSRTPLMIRKRSPLLGEDNDYVFHTLLGMDKSTIERLKEKKVIY